MLQVQLHQRQDVRRRLRRRERDPQELLPQGVRAACQHELLHCLLQEGQDVV